LIRQRCAARSSIVGAWPASAVAHSSPAVVRNPLVAASSAQVASASRHWVSGSSASLVPGGTTRPEVSAVHTSTNPRAAPRIDAASAALNTTDHGSR
jgi:hypothetical protein